MDKLIAPKHDGSVFSIRYGASTMLLFGYSRHWAAVRQLSCEQYINKKKPNTRYINQIFSNLTSLSGYQDSNLGPPAPKAGALTGLRYTPKKDTSFMEKRCKGTTFFCTGKYFGTFF